MSHSQNLTSDVVFAGLKEGTILLVDVREVHEYDSNRIHGALLFPLSTFDAKALPTDGSRKLVFQCGSGMRSRKALDIYIAETGIHTAGHLEGGIGAWKAAGFPTASVDLATGQLVDKGRY